MRRTRKKSTISATRDSLWPTPTVSTKTTSNPAASRTTIVSLLLWVTPPKSPEAGEGRINAALLDESRSMRVLSPRIEPPETELDGSTARTATRWPLSVSCVPNSSIKVLFPTPGAPVTPIRLDEPE